MTSTRRNISQPADWWAAFARQAQAAGLSLSEWIGDCGLYRLPVAARRKLSQRPVTGRPRKNESCRSD